MRSQLIPSLNFAMTGGAQSRDRFFVVLLLVLFFSISLFNRLESNPNSSSQTRSSRARGCGAAFHRCLFAASPRDAARSRGGLRVLREWVLARSVTASPFARACALHLLCRDAGVLHDTGMRCWLVAGRVLSAAC